MAESTPLPTSRRALLAATLGAAAASVAGALGRPGAARAADAGNLIIGQDNDSSTVTRITNGDDAEVAFHARATATGGPTNALIGEITTGLSGTSAGVRGINTSGVGVRGTSVNGSGVAGDSASGSGVYGVSGTGHGVYGAGANADAIRGVASGTGSGVSGHSALGAGVKGTTDNPQAVGVDGTAQYVGISGQALNEGGIGMFGTAESGQTGVGTGVFGQVNASGTGIHAYAGDSGPAAALSGVGVHAESEFGWGLYASSGASDAIYGEATDPGSAGVAGYNASGNGVWGGSGNGTGVGGGSSDGSAVTGLSQSATKAAILGHAAGPGAGSERTGVLGFSGQTAPASAPAKTGVYGYAAQDSTANGVYGRTTGGRGLYGQATSGSGVYGTATTGYALRTIGRLKLEKTSGSVVIASGATVSANITPGVALTSSSLVIATIQTNGGANVAVKRVTVTTGPAGFFTITLTTAPSANVKVAWLLLN